MEKARQKTQQEPLLPFQLYPLGDAGVVLQFGDQISSETLGKIKAYTSSLEANWLPGLIEVVPAYTTLTIYYNPWLVSKQGALDPYEVIARHLRQLADLAPLAAATTTNIIEIPVCYGGIFGPDIEFVARHCGLSPEEIISLHSKAEYLVYMIGFVPGFPYLGGMDPSLATPRKINPATRIPAGSVGIAGLQTGIYPLETPGGWQLIGRTPLRLLDTSREHPSLLQAGDRIHFKPITTAEFNTIKAAAHES